MCTEENNRERTGQLNERANEREQEESLNVNNK
jgi:hypothetical protein